MVNAPSLLVCQTLAVGRVFFLQDVLLHKFVMMTSLSFLSLLPRGRISNIS